MRVKIVTFVPVENADGIREALGRAGAGAIGEYSYCSYSVVGKGRFLPSEAAKPHIGKAESYETVTEQRIEVECDRSIAKDIVKAIKLVHPYEEVVIDVYPLIDESEL